MTINFEKGSGLIPAVIQDYISKKVLMLGFMNEDAWHQTRDTGKVTFFSRTKDRIWVKGETSGNFLMVRDIFIDCDADTVLIMAEPKGPVCHTGALDCFNQPENSSGFIHRLQQVIQEKAQADPEKSYTASLLQKGIQKVAQKVGEEAVETILEAQSGPDHLLLNESADLIYHLLVLLHARGLELSDVEAVLAKRHLLKSAH